MAGTKYSFQVQIPNPADIQALREGGYQLGVVKKSNVQTGSAIQVQWLSVQILAGTISVSWDEEYFLYFTTQDLSKDGVTIMQGSSLAATMGQK